MPQAQTKDVVERIEQFDRNDSRSKWGSAIRPSPNLGPVIPVEVVNERLAKLEQTVVALKQECRTLNETLARQKTKTRIYVMTAMLAGTVIWAASSYLFANG